MEEQTSTLIDNWNGLVSSGDDCYILGDFSLGGEDQTLEVIKALKGKLHLVAGNHDRRLLKTKVRDQFVWVRDIHELSVREDTPGPGVWRGQRKLVLCHFPFLTWHKSHFGSFNLHGHCHGSSPSVGKLQLDVGVDCHDYKPISYEQVKAILKPTIDTWTLPSRGVQ